MPKSTLQKLCELAIYEQTKKKREIIVKLSHNTDIDTTNNLLDHLDECNATIKDCKALLKADREYRKLLKKHG